MNLYLENLQFLKTNAADLYNKVIAETPLFPDLHITAQGGVAKAYMGQVECYLQSSYSVEQEFEWLFREWNEGTDAAVVFGCGLFDMVPYMVNRFKNLKKIIFVEPTLQVFDYFLHHKNFVEIFKRATGIQLVFVVNFNEAAAMQDISNTLLGSRVMNVAARIPYRILFNAYYHELSERLMNAFEMTSAILFNDWKNQTLWLREVLRNFYLKAFPAESLASIIRGRPVILVGGGPSLAKNMHFLAQAQDKAVIIACGKAVQILNRAKIRTHFNAGLDSMDVNYYDDLAFPDVPLIFANQMSSAMVARYSGEKFQMLTNGDPINAYIYREAKQRDTIFSVGTSIINTMYDFVARLGCGEVIFIGQDMCFYDDKIYADADERSSSATFASTLKIRQDIFGNDVYTATAYYSIQWGLERDRKRYMEIPITNATEGGLGIWGAPNKRLEEVLDQLPGIGQPIQHEVQAFIAAASTNDRMSSLECWDSIDGAKLLTEVSQMTDEILSRIERLGKLYHNKAKTVKITKEIEKIEKLYANLDKHDFFAKVIAPYLEAIFTVFDGYEPHWSEKNIEIRVAGFVKKYLGKLTEIKKYCGLIQEESCLVRESEVNKG